MSDKTKYLFADDPFASPILLPISGPDHVVDPDNIVPPDLPYYDDPYYTDNK